MNATVVSSGKSCCSSGRTRTIRAGPFTVRLGAYEPCCGAGKHRHAEPRLVLPLGASFETRSNRRHFDVEPGTVAFRPLESEHEDRYPVPIRCAAILLPSGGASSFGTSLAILRKPALAAIAREFDNELVRTQPDAVAALKLEPACHELLSALARRATEPPAWIESARARLEACTENEDLSLDALAAGFDLDPAYVARAFKRRFGVSTGGYARRMRLRKAYALLAAGHPAVSVAAQSGFADQSHLSRAFKAAFGCTPGALRRERTIESGSSSRSRRV